MNHFRHLVACWCPALLLLAAGPVRAETVIWSDNFETNATTRWQTGDWKIGSPTAGPPANSAGYRTYSGANCASTQKYANNEDTRLICINYNGSSSLTIPSADQYPRLRFWQWFNFANALGYVEISTNSGGSWTQISPTYENINSGGTWSSPYLDLSGYAGQKARIAFHFTSGGCCGNALGWFVDDVAVVTGIPALNFPEGFESDPKTSDWSMDYGTWEIGHPTSGPGGAHTGTNCAATVLAGNYANNVDSRLISPPFQVPASGNPALRFWQWYNFNNALGYVELNNGSITVTTVTNTIITTNDSPVLNTNLYQLFGSTDPSYADPFYWNPTIRDWTNDLGKALGYVALANVGTNFESGYATIPLGGNNVDYRGAILPIPLAAPTNFLQWQGMIWNPVANESDNPTGFFGTNYVQTYSTNTTVSSSQSNWTQISPTYEDSSSGGWKTASLDLTAFESQTVYIAFHFTSGGEYTDPGWYVDDLTLAVPPLLIVPTNEVINAGDELLAPLAASNNLLPNAQYTFKLLSAPAGVFLTNGVVAWQTSTNQPSSTNTITVSVADNSVPPLGATNSFVVTVINPWTPILTVPATQTIYAGQTMLVTVSATNDFYPDDTFTFALLSPVLTNLDVSDLTDDGVINWPTVTTQRPGTNTIVIEVTDQDSLFSATNSFLVVLLKAPPPVLTVPPTQTNYAGQELDVFVSATNSAFLDASYTFAITNAPPISIDPNSGELTWPTLPTNKTQNASIAVVVTDDHTPPLSATNRFSVVILPTPRPTLIVPATQTNYAGQPLGNLTFTATNGILTNAVYTFSLSPPTSPSTNVMVTNSGPAMAVLTWTNTGIKNGILTWTNNSVSPGAKTIYVQVQDDTWPQYPNLATNHFTLVFLPPRPPALNPPTNQVIYAGQRFTNVLSATNGILPAAKYTYALARASTNCLIKTNVLTWTNAITAPGSYALYVRVTDNSVPPILTTNVFSVVVQPVPAELSLARMARLPSGGVRFVFDIQSPWSNTVWRIEAATNLNAAATNWLPIYTNKTGPGNLLFTDLLGTNFLQRYYRVVMP